MSRLPAAMHYWAFISHEAFTCVWFIIHVNRFLAYAIGVSHVFRMPYACIHSKSGLFSYLDLWCASTHCSVSPVHKVSPPFSLFSCAIEASHIPTHLFLLIFPQLMEIERKGQRWKKNCRNKCGLRSEREAEGGVGGIQLASCRFLFF